LFWCDERVGSDEFVWGLRILQCFFYVGF